ncbi:MAG: NADH-quinone oxidoreductase subunit H [Pirellulales bacterium]|nr:NADH-quinone oxidoreductase subunit H [Pirellulales bacterium]
MVAPSGLISLALALALAPMMPSIINRTKALFAGRHGQPWLQPYRELWKLLHKGAVYSHTTTPVFFTGPIVGCAAMLVGLLFVPLAGTHPLISFPGDFLLVAYLLGLARFFTVSAALDTGSSFEGMGASREVFFSALAEPALLLALATLAALSGQLSLADIFARIDAGVLASGAGPALLLAAAAMMVVFLAENARIPVDDPNTHLELTMIHEVMVLDHSGPDLAAIQYAACLKMWILGSLLVSVLLPVRSGWLLADLGAGILGLGLLAVATGVVESVMARLRLVRVPQFLIAASILSIVALVLVVR